MDGLFRLAVGALFGALLIIAISPVLLTAPSHWMAGTGVLVFGSSLVLGYTAEDIRRSTGRCLLMFGSVLMFLPILSVLIVAFLGGHPSSSNQALAAGGAGGFSARSMAALIAFSAGAALAALGMVILSDRRKRRRDLVDEVMEATYLPYHSGRGGRRPGTLSTSYRSSAIAPDDLAIPSLPLEASIPAPRQSAVRRMWGTEPARREDIRL